MGNNGSHVSDTVSLHGRCSVLHCHQRSDGVVMNSLGYCERHSGLALFNGLRHTPRMKRTAQMETFCAVCQTGLYPRLGYNLVTQLWSVVGLKSSMDRGHVYNHQRSMQSPVREVSTGDIRVRYTVWCAPSVDHFIPRSYNMTHRSLNSRMNTAHSLHSFVFNRGRGTKFSTTDGRAIRVPRDVWLRFERDQWTGRDHRIAYR